ncbi:MAG: DUF721 domain-containing protein [Coriobacteriia bacterium]|nr:DUF721 domain-containing protein [Coriobacteriia bacterium]
MKRAGKQTPLASALDVLGRRLDVKSDGRYLQMRINEAWEKTAGPTVAEHTARVHLRSGELVVHVDSNVWASELSALAGPYAKRLNEELGKELVRTIRFTVSRAVRERVRQEGVEEEKDTYYQPAPELAQPLSLNERAQVEASAGVIEDPQLREAVVKATVASMEWQKGQKAVKTREEPSGGL